MNYEDIAFIDKDGNVYQGREIEGFEDYLITRDGKVWSIRRQQFCAFWDNHTGYDLITLKCGDKKKHKRVHRLVAQAYIPNPEGLETVDHIDEDKHNNDMSNLRWLSRSDNIKAYHRNHPYVKGDEK